MRILIEIDCDGAAFDGDSLPVEVGLILGSLRETIRRCEYIPSPYALTDTNGNRCGTLRVEG